jgi:hypothetical protein
MIPSTNTQLLVAEDWKKIYQSFRNADFKSYDFETLRRTMIAYLKENYPEDFNDYIDSSEYIALIDLIAFLGQNLSFRIDLNARENFLETAERRESILRLARLINYNAKRNTPSHGFLKITSISTTENVIDSNGVNLSNSIIGWNDPTNTNWYQQYISIINAVVSSPTVFGKPLSNKVIDGISTEKYKINTNTADVPVYTFSKNVGGTQMSFELVSSTFDGQSYIYEETPTPASQFGIIFKNDNKGSASANTGFFVQFKQGSLSASNFTVSSPVPNEIVGVNVPDINDTDVWLWQLSPDGTKHQTLWTKVSSVTGNNIIYNSVNKSERNVYGVITREKDQVDLTFADGSFGNLPNGPFRLYYRQSNGLSYSIKPEQMNNISVKIPYTSKSGQSHSLTLVLSLQYTVMNSSASESDASIKLKAPQAYYTQNRMVTAEDYNIAPMSVDSEIVKIKSVNRLSSGISKYYELSDITGKYSRTNIFANDGALYKEQREYNFEFTFDSRNEILEVIKKQVAPIIKSPSLKSFYLDQYERLDLSGYNLRWVQSNKTTNQTRGYFLGPNGPTNIGYFGSNYLSFLEPGSLVKFVPPTGKYFLPNGKLTSIMSNKTKSYIWSQIVGVTGDGSNSGLGNLPDGTGPVIITGNIPGDGTISNSATAMEIIPKFYNILTYSLEVELTNLALTKKNFGLSFDKQTRSWYIIADTNLDLKSPFSLIYQKDITNVNKDASWMVAFEWTGKKYKVRYRNTNYIFESDKETAFFVDKSKKNYDFTTDTVIKDKITVLSINTLPNDLSMAALGTDYLWQVDNPIVEPDGYIEPKKVLVSFYDNNEDGYIDDPDSFNTIVSPNSVDPQTGFKNSFVYFQKQSDGLRYNMVDPELLGIMPCTNEIDLQEWFDTNAVDPEIGSLYYFYDDSINIVKRWNGTSFDIEPSYYAYPGRNSLKFHYVHNSGDDRRLDPSKTNIIDVYLLTTSYDSMYRSWLSTGTGSEPLPPTTQSLEENYSQALNPIKSISDEIVYHPAKYKVLFGSKAEPQLQATFKAVRNPARIVSTSDIQSRILSAIEDFFKIDNWEFGQTFNFSELSTYVMNIMTPDITNFVIVPKMDSGFGSLYQITCLGDEIFVSGTTVNDIQVIDSLTASELKASNISSI